MYAIVMLICNQVIIMQLCQRYIIMFSLHTPTADVKNPFACFGSSQPGNNSVGLTAKNLSKKTKATEVYFFFALKSIFYVWVESFISPVFRLSALAARTRPSGVMLEIPDNRTGQIKCLKVCEISHIHRF